LNSQYQAHLIKHAHTHKREACLSEPASRAARVPMGEMEVPRKLSTEHENYIFQFGISYHTEKVPIIRVLPSGNRLRLDEIRTAEMSKERQLIGINIRFHKREETITASGGLNHRIGTAHSPVENRPGVGVSGTQKLELIHTLPHRINNVADTLRTQPLGVAFQGAHIGSLTVESLNMYLETIHASIAENKSSIEAFAQEMHEYRLELKKLDSKIKATKDEMKTKEGEDRRQLKKDVT
ncbi:6316_t:CDS:2, partial [Acaulospora colombiana]